MRRIKAAATSTADAAAAAAAASPGLVGVARHLLVEKMIKVATSDGEDFKCMVMDREGTRVLSACCSMSEIAALGVTHTDDLSKDRQPQPQLGAIYFVAPTQASVRRIVNDFHKKRSIKMYSEAWLFFTRAIPDFLFEQIQLEMRLNEGFRHAVVLCREINLEFVPLDRNLFSLDMPEYFYQTYRPRDHGEVVGEEENYDRIVERLFHLCINVGETPDIAFFDMEPAPKAAPQSGYTSDWMRVSMQVQTDVSKIAILLRERLRTFSMQETSAAFSSEMRGVFRESFGAKKAGQKSAPKNNALLVLVDRSVDPLGPLLHDLFYESLVHDTVALTEYGDLELAYQNAQGEKKLTHTPLSDPADPIWTRCKHMHLADFLNYINDAFNDFKEEFSEFFPSASGAEANPDLKARMERMTEYAEKNAQFSKHLHLHKLLTSAFNDRHMREMCELEMLMTSGRDVWDESVEPQDVLASVSGLLGNVNLGDEDKMRLLLIYYVALGSAATESDDNGSAAAGARGVEFQGLRQQAFPQGVPSKYAAVLKQLESHNVQIHLDMKVQKTGLGSKKSVSYGYGKARRRHRTEASGDEYNPQRPPKPGVGAAGEGTSPKRGLLDRLGEKLGGGPDVEISDRDSLSRFEPTLYWLVKDLARGRENAHQGYWCGLDADENTPCRDYTLKKRLEWLAYDKAQQQTAGRRRAGAVDKQRTIILCVLGGVSYGEVRAAAEIERRTGCTVLIGGTEVLTPSTFLDRLSMEGDWTTLVREPEPPKYDPKHDAAAAAAAAAEGRQPAGCIDQCVEKLIDKVPACLMRTLCCDDDEEVSRPVATGGSGGRAGGRGTGGPELQTMGGDESLVPRP